MKLDDMIELLVHTRKTLPGDTPVCFMQGFGRDRKAFDFGEQGRDGYCCAITPYETRMYVDGFGRFHIPIRQVPEPPETFTPINFHPTPEDDAKHELLAVKIRKLFTGEEA